MLQYFPNITGSLTVSGDVIVSGSIATTQGITISGSIDSASYSSNSEKLDNLDSTAFVFTSSFNTYSSSMSSRVGNIEGNYATTGSNIFMGAQTVCANITSTGTIIAQTLNVQQVTSSVVYSSGSNIFGCLPSDVQQFTGSLRVTGSGNHWFQAGCVGIGTTTPCQKFHVFGQSDGTKGRFELYGVGGINEVLQVSNTANWNPGRGVKVGLYVNSGSNQSQIGAEIGAVTIAADALGADLFFNVASAGVATERFRITSTGIACFACQTCAPGMDIMPSGIGVSTLGGIMRVVTTGTSTGIAVGQSNTNRYTHFAANDIQVFNDDFFLTTRCAFPLSIGTCYTARLTFAATGIACFSCRVCTPVITITGCSTSTIFEGYNQNTDDGNGLYIKAGGVNSGKYVMALENAAGCSRMIVLANGNVGIGTTSVPFGLTVYRPSTSQGDTSTNLLLFDTTGYGTGVGGGISFGGYYNNTNSEIYTYGYVKGGKENSTNDNFAGYVSFGTRASASGASAERMRINSCGCVSIGTACSISTLTIKSVNDGGIVLTRPSNDTTSHLRISTTETGGDPYTVKYNTFNNEMIFNTYSGGGTGGNIIFRTTCVGPGSEAERLRINCHGIVTIACQVCAPIFKGGSSIQLSSYTYQFTANKTFNENTSDVEFFKIAMSSGVAAVFVNFTAFNAGTAAYKMQTYHGILSNDYTGWVGCGIEVTGNPSCRASFGVSSVNSVAVYTQCIVFRVSTSNNGTSTTSIGSADITVVTNGNVPTFTQL